MYSHPIKKLFALIVFFSLTIVGIFVLQFRSESVFSDNIGFLRFTLAKTESDASSPNSKQVVLRNSLQADFKGLTVYFDESNPAYVKMADSSSRKNITLISWDKASPLEYIFYFTENVAISFALSSEEADAKLTITADIPEKISEVFFHYRPSNGFTLTNILNKKSSQIEITDKKNKYILKAAQIFGDSFSLTNKQLLANYSMVNENEKFSFDMLKSYAISNPNLTEKNIRQLENNIISLFNGAVKNNKTLTEESVVSYVAIMANNGQYNVALENVPESFKKGQKRTYISAPYFNSLEQMTSTLETHLNNTTKIVEQSIASMDCDVFTIERLSNYIIQNKESEKVLKLLEMPSNIAASQIKPFQAAGIIETYTNLQEKYPLQASKLQKVLDTCVSVIEKACSVENDKEKLTILDDNIKSEPINTLKIGNSLLNYGKLIQNENLINSGNAIINSYFNENKMDDLHTCSKIYPLLVHNNSYYPHLVMLPELNSKAWAWTCAKKIDYMEQEEEISIKITFPEELTHYIIIGSIPMFKNIQIYGINFRTDPRFEIYNSSGYVYKKDSEILLLKSRHKTEVEEIKLSY